MKHILILATLLICITSCKQVEQEVEIKEEVAAAPLSGSFAHTVYFWLKEPQNTKAQAAFEQSLSKFITNSPDIATYHLGKPASTNRPIIDTSYSYALLTTFEDKAAHDRYQEDPAHKLFIKESETLWNKVLIYDSVDVLK